MAKNRIELDFGTMVLEADLFDTDLAQRFFEQLPYAVNLTQWGSELYGAIGVDLGEENPVPDIPAGGIAYTRQGNYVCIFFGQTPAWAVEYIGQIDDGHWPRLHDLVNPQQLIIRLKG